MYFLSLSSTEPFLRCASVVWGIGKGLGNSYKVLHNSDDIVTVVASISLDLMMRQNFQWLYASTKKNKVAKRPPNQYLKEAILFYSYNGNQCFCNYRHLRFAGRRSLRVIITFRY